MDSIEPVTIRPATLSDAPTITTLTIQLGYPTTSEQILERLEGILNSPNHALYVADSNGGVIGWIHVFRTSYIQSEPFAEIGGLVVDAPYQGRGIGQSLIVAAETWAMTNGLASLRVRSNVLRNGAHEFYPRIGYTLTKSQHVYVKPISPD